jgi:hypothetical protein
MIADDQRLIINPNREIQPRDSITIKNRLEFRWKDRVRILTGSTVYLVTQVRTQNKVGTAVAETQMAVTKKFKKPEAPAANPTKTKGATR